jgi:DNA-binding CsgD family transcriptional regulator
MMSVVGREFEQAELGRLVDRARDGLSGVLVLRGDAGMGKTSLVDALASSATDFDIVRLVGIESEMRLGYAALHQLLTPFADGIDDLPAPQACALRAAFGLSEAAPPDQFVVGLAALTMITSAATRHPLLILVDDAQWLDQDSGTALGFLARRLYADRVCLVVSTRDSVEGRQLFDGLPSLDLNSLPESASVEILNAAVHAPLADQVSARILADARGNPLALIEFARALSSDQAAGAEQLPEPLVVSRRLEGHFLQQFGALPAATRRLLITAAAEPTGDANSIWRAGLELDFDVDAITPAHDAGLLDAGPHVGPFIVFRHPVIRSAVYQGSSPSERCRAHEALARACDADSDADRRAWHRAAAASSPDDAVATELEHAAHRAGERGSCAAAAALLSRAAQLTQDPDQRAIRLLQAAGADFTAGSPVRAQAHLARALPDLHDPMLLARARKLEAGISYFNALRAPRADADGSGRVGESVSIMLDAARAFEPLDIGLARDSAFDAIQIAVYFDDSKSVSAVDVAQQAQAFRLPSGRTPTANDLLLDATAQLLANGYRSAGPLLRDALSIARTDADIRNVPRQLARACWIAFALSDEDLVRNLGEACAATCREQGAFQVLPEALDYLGMQEVRTGSLTAADDIFAEVVGLQETFRRSAGAGGAARVIVAAWRGHEDEVRAKAAQIIGGATQHGLVVRWAEYALIVLELGLGNYQAASSLTWDLWDQDVMLGALRAADTVEAHVRSGNHAAAVNALTYLSERAAANESTLDLGLLARSRALMASDADAEVYFRDATAHLGSCGARLHLARSQLVYGEWLRRQKRRRDARIQLDAAREGFEAMGARGFAERARVELLATGAQARRRVDETRHELTPQESQVARLAAAGLTNPEIATRLFISASTVDYHLRKVYRKLDIKSRHELSGIVPST